jgi:hypothetical protein
VKDTSPLIAYSAGWECPTDDPHIQSYSGQSFHKTKIVVRLQFIIFDRTPIRGQGANATLHFFGSAVYVYGAKRARYVSHPVSSLSLSPSPPHRGLQGSYQIVLDEEIDRRTAKSQDPTFQSLLYSRTGLNSSWHFLTISNEAQTAPDWWIDVDFIVFTNSDGQEE